MAASLQLLQVCGVCACLCVWDTKTFRNDRYAVSLSQRTCILKDSLFLPSYHLCLMLILCPSCFICPPPNPHHIHYHLSRYSRSAQDNIPLYDAHSFVSRGAFAHMHAFIDIVWSQVFTPSDKWYRRITVSASLLVAAHSWAEWAFVVNGYHMKRGKVWVFLLSPWLSTSLLEDQRERLRTWFMHF